ncbi:MAG: hypothetical protein OXC37_03095 [Bdellovibrionaceae bacterium]|nr:hypothetical protein [Pseudobdellovibrionaceae bacterium]
MRFLFCFAFLFSISAHARIYINVGAPENIKKSIIALSEFRLKAETSDKKSLSIGEKMTERLNKNLKFSSYFNVLSSKAFIENPNLLEPVPYLKNSKGFRWQNWKLSGADFLFFADYSISDENLLIDVYFYNVNSQKRILKKNYKGAQFQSLKIIDKISNDIVKKLSGREGIFETKIIAVRSMDSVKKEIFVMDWNGERKKRITYHRSIVLSPSWSTKGSQIVYSAFMYNKKIKTRVAALFLYNFKTNKAKVLSAERGANLGSEFFPQDRELLVTLGRGRGQLDIFKFNLRTFKLFPLTQGPRGVINVEPSIHNRNRRVAFSSDRNGKTMIYTMNSRGRDLKQLTYAGHYNSNPDWHPYKNEIVFSGMSQGRMDLFKISSQGTGLKRLTSLRRDNGSWANCESPSFSPDGRFVVFSSDISGTYQLYIMNLDDLSIERITFDRHNYKSPKWSPYL